MATVSLYGSSDDKLEVRGTGISKTFEGVLSWKGCRITVTVSSTYRHEEAGSIIVTAIYSNDGRWTLNRVSPGDKPLPEGWRVVDTECFTEKHSNMLTVVTPGDITVEKLC